MNRTHEETLELLGFLLEKGAVHVKVGDVEAMLPPPAGEIGQIPDMPEYEEGSLKQWINTPVPLRGPGK